MARGWPGALLVLSWSGLAAAAPPLEFSTQFGKHVQSCIGCHGGPPSLPHSESASRIVAVGAAARNGAELRAAMSRETLGGVMSRVLDDPALTDDKLDAIRLYLVKVRDGDPPAAVDFGDAMVGASSAPQRVVIKNERPARDAPSVIASINATGDFAVVRGGTCKPKGRLAGQASCSVNVRFTPKSAGAKSGTLEFLLAPTPELTPQKQSTVLSGAGISK